jgi:ATP-binding cassette, subfamily G (WHITE), member 2, SNQ2
MFLDIHFWPLIYIPDRSSTRGLDASTALEFARALRIATDIARLSTIVSIYQASESLYQCFNKVCVIYEGKMAYYGPADQARQYFIDMGYEPANRQTTADFLVAVTDSFGRIERPNVLSIPRTAQDFADYFRKSNIGQANREDMESYRAEFVGQEKRASTYIESVRAEHSQHTRKKSPYTISIPMQIRAVMVRRVQILLGNITAQVMQLT